MALYKFEEYTFNTQTMELSRDGKKLHLRSRNARLLLFFLQNKCRILTKEELFNKVWENQSVSEQVLFQGIKELRETFESTAKVPRFIFTYPKQGYMWDVKETTLLETPQEEPPVQKKPTLKTGLVISGILILVAALFYPGHRFWRNKTIQPPKLQPKRIAILPLLTMDNREDTVWAKAGIEELLSYSFERNPHISCIPQQTIVNASTAWFPDFTLHEVEKDNQDIQSIRNKFGVDFVICGRINHDEEKTNLFIQLFNKSGLVYYDYWSESDISLLIRNVYSELSMFVDPQGYTLDEKKWEFSGYIAETYARGVVAYNKNDIAHAKKFFNFCLELQPDFDLAKLLLSACHRASNEYSQALSLLLDLSSNANEKDPEFRSAIYLQTAINYNFLGNREKAVEVLEQGITFARKQGNPYILAEFLNLKGQWYSDGKGTTPDELFGEALHLFEGIGDNYGQSMVLASMARWYEDRGFFEKSSTLFIQLKHTYERLDYNWGSARASFNLGNIAMQTHQPETALEHITRAKVLFETCGRPQDVIACHTMTGEIALSRGRWEEAQKELLYANSQFEALRNEESEYLLDELYIWICLGMGNERFGSQKQGNAYFHKAEDRVKDLQRPSIEALISLWKGDLLAKEHHFNEARTHYQSAKNTNIELNNKMGTRDALLSLAYLDIQENKDQSFHSIMKQVQEMDPSHPFTQVLEIEYELRHGHGEQAKIQFEHLLKQFPYLKELLGEETVARYALAKPIKPSSLYPLMLSLP